MDNQDQYLVEPDLDFIRAIMADGGENLKKCFQCATCSVACNLAPDRQPFPRKEMLYAGWGLKDRLMAGPDIWLCYNCGDCSTLCPRQAEPGSTLAAIRRLWIREYSRPTLFHRLFESPKFLPLQIILPAIVILLIGRTTGLLNLHHDGGPIVYDHFFPVTLIEIIFIPLSILVGLVFLRGIRNMLAAMRRHDARRDPRNDNPLRPLPFLKTFWATLPTIIRHENFALCTQNRSRKQSHMLVSIAFVNLALVAGAFVFALYVMGSHGPYSQLNPVKIFANLSGIALVVGSVLMLIDRLNSAREGGGYFDWHLIGLALLLGLTGMATQLVRLAGLPTTAIVMYFVHLILAFNLIAFLPYSKLAHFVYRTFAVTYRDYTRQRQINS